MQRRLPLVDVTVTVAGTSKSGKSRLLKAIEKAVYATELPLGFKVDLNMTERLVRPTSTSSNR